MDLSDRGGRYGYGVEPLEQALDGEPKVFLDDRPRFVHGEGRHPVLQLHKLED